MVISFCATNITNERKTYILYDKICDRFLIIPIKSKFKQGKLEVDRGLSDYDHMKFLSSGAE